MPNICLIKLLMIRHIFIFLCSCKPVSTFKYILEGNCKAMEIEINFIVNDKSLGVKNVDLNQFVPNQFEEKKNSDLNEAKKKKVKDIANYIQALCIVEYDGKEITDPAEKLAIFKTFRRSSLLDHISFLDLINFGVSNEQEFVCTQDGCDKSNGRLLRKELHPLEFLPITNDSKDKLRSVKRGKIFM